MIADITELTLDVPESGAQGAALGAARLAMLGCGEAAETEVIRPPKIRKSIAANPALTAAYAERYADFRAAWEQRLAQ
ncbi:MAG: hypothetical protein ABJN05_10395 [Sulfitobacter dubius]